MASGIPAWIRATLTEARRSRLSWALAAYALAVAGLPFLLRPTDATARPMLVASALHAVTAAFGLALSIFFPARLLGRDLSDRLLYTAFTKPAAKGAYFGGRLAGFWILATVFALFALAFGGGLLAWVDAHVGPVATRETAARATGLRLARDRVVLHWDLPGGAGPLSARVESLNNLYWSPRVEAIFKRLPDGPQTTREFTWSAGVQILDLAVPGAVRAQGPGAVELTLRSFSQEPFGPHFTARGTYELVREARSYVRLWAGDLACLWISWLLFSSVAFFFSSFCSWTLAAVASLTLCLAFHSLDFLKELPGLLTPRTISSILSPTIFEQAHRHTDGEPCGDGHGEPHPDAGVLWLARRLAERTVPVFCRHTPDLARDDLARRMERGHLVEARQWKRLAGEILPWVVVLMLAGWARLSRLEPA